MLNPEGCPETGVASLERLEHVQNALHKSGINLRFARVSDPVRDVFDRNGLLDAWAKGESTQAAMLRSTPCSRQQGFRFKPEARNVHSAGQR